MFKQGLLKAVYEVIQCGRLEGKLSKVQFNTLTHDISANKDVYLFEEAGPFSITDLIIVVDCVIRMVDSDLYWMSGPLGIVI